MIRYIELGGVLPSRVSNKEGGKHWVKCLPPKTSERGSEA